MARRSRTSWLPVGPRNFGRLLLTSVIALLCWSQPAFATGLIVVPHTGSQRGLSYFKLQSRPGAVKHIGSIELRNPSSRPMRVVLSPVDGMTLSTLGSGYASPGTGQHLSTRWLALDHSRVELRPHGRAVVPVSINVPSQARPGDYLAGVSIEELNQQAQTTKRKEVSIASVSRYAIGVEVSLPGPRHPLIRFTGARIQRQPAGLAFLLSARNSGNVILPGAYGHVRITRAGKTVVSQAIEPGTFVTHSGIAYPVTAYRQLPAEGTRYAISAWLRYPGGIARLNTTVLFGHHQAAIQRQYASGPTAAAPAGTAWWKIAAAAAVGLYALGTTALLLRRRIRRPRVSI